ncbi:transmembrane protein 198-like [Lytechinus variegatus]|uniref:transmembrane protein 198-like n=1 Tax=Lytechinus variegatus TaxID=7654 RepID=UPI001BB14B64|nr:transmembrane protein 198-like [Lytechinus variegatus]XP_041478011.1 transmembrane protein 198-like [Lytechinus variegatus]XP_041478013.1 transmembrane protein 198-like [Lytechinus variegatus]
MDPMVTQSSSSAFWEDYYDRSDIQTPVDLVNNSDGPLIPSSFYPTVPTPECGVMNYRYNIPTAVVCGISFIFGIIFNFFGYRCFKAVMFLVGFILASVVSFLICQEQSSLATGANAGIALAIGLLCGLITMLIQIVGLFMTGVHMGLFSAIIVLIIVEQFVHMDVLLVPIGITFGLGIIFGLITLKFQRTFVILATSLIGGAIVATCTDYYLELFRMVNYVYDRFRLQVSLEPCWYSWLILALWPFVSLVGIIIQFKVTAKGFNHKQVSGHTKTRRVELQKLRQREAREEVRAQKYCDLYRARSRNADIVTQSYLQSIHDHLSPEMQRIASIQHIPSEPAIPFTDSSNTNTDTMTTLQTTMDEIPSKTIDSIEGMTKVEEGEIVEV